MTEYPDGGGYRNVHCGLLDSSVWGLSKESRILWVTMLLKKNRRQFVTCSLPGLARAANLTEDEVILALEELMAPDPYSRTEGNGGRRIEKVEGGWLIINGGLYRGDADEEDRKEAHRLAQARYRERRKARSDASDGETVYGAATVAQASARQLDSIVQESVSGKRGAAVDDLGPGAMELPAAGVGKTVELPPRPGTDGDIERRMLQVLGSAED